jgi:phosphate uptake regulator
MKRKVIQLSTSTKVVSLPSSWTAKNGIKKGSELEVKEKDNMLIFSKESANTSRKAEFDLKDFEGHAIYMILDAYYISGYDDILIKTSSSKQRDVLQKAKSEFPGLIVYEQKGEYMRMKNIIVQEEFGLFEIMGRIRNITITMIDDCLDAIENKQWIVLAEIKKRDYIINTYISLAFRYLNKYGYEPMSKLSAIALHFKVLEMFSDRLCSLFIHIAEKKEISTKQKRILSEIRDLYRKESALTGKFSMEKLREFEEERQKIKQSAEKEQGNIGSELLELVNIFYEIEEIALGLGLK